LSRHMLTHLGNKKREVDAADESPDVKIARLDRENGECRATCRK
jgi:hypothetical protein